MKPASCVFPILLVLLASCSTKPEAIRYGKEECQNCHMTIFNSRFGAEWISATGKAYKFDCVECLRTYLHAHALPQKGSRIYVTDFSRPGSWIPAPRAFYARDSSFRSPMGGDIAAFATRGELLALEPDRKDSLQDWSSILNEPNSLIPYEK